MVSMASTTTLMTCSCFPTKGQKEEEAFRSPHSCSVQYVIMKTRVTTETGGYDPRRGRSCKKTDSSVALFFSRLREEKQKKVKNAFTNLDGAFFFDAFFVERQEKTTKTMSTSGPPAASAAAEAPADRGLYCSTSGTYFTDKEALTAHYKSDFHRCVWRERAQREKNASLFCFF